MYEWVVADWQMLLRGVQLKFNTKGAVTAPRLNQKFTHQWTQNLFEEH